MALEIVWRNPNPTAKGRRKSGLVEPEREVSFYIVHSGKNEVIFQIHREWVRRLLAERGVEEAQAKWHSRL